jgi:hypothetical protein
MDGPLAFAVQDVPSEVLAFSLFITRWAEDGYIRCQKLDNFRRNFSLLLFG